jgi:hypothetical protein
MLNAIVIAIRLNILVFSGYKQVAIRKCCASSAIGRIQAQCKRPQASRQDWMNAKPTVGRWKVAIAPTIAAVMILYQRL